MRQEPYWRRLWSDITDHPLALIVALIGIAIAAFGADPDDFSLALCLVGVVPALGAIAWVLYRILQAGARRSRLRRSLGAALGAAGDGAAKVAGDGFPDIPLCLGRHNVYGARETDVAVLPIDHLVWAYAEKFLFRRHTQLVLWNRDATAIVLPVRKRYRNDALERLRQAAPWLPVGYNEAMKESWNADHADFLALVEAHRQSGRRFDAPWAGRGMAGVAAPLKPSNLLAERERRQEQAELEKLQQRWAGDQK